VLEMQLVNRFINGHKDHKATSPSQKSAEMYVKNKNKKRNISLLLQTMDNEIFSDFRKRLDSSDIDQYMPIDFRSF